MEFISQSVSQSGILLKCNKMESTFGHRNITYEKARAVHELDSFSTLPNLRQKSVRTWCMNPSESDQCDKCTENDQIV